MHSEKHPQAAQLNALELGIIENAVAQFIELSRRNGGYGGTFDCLRLIALSTVAGSRYQAQCTAEGAQAIAAAIDRNTAVLAALARQLPASTVHPVAHHALAHAANDAPAD